MASVDAAYTDLHGYLNEPVRALLSRFRPEAPADPADPAQSGGPAGSPPQPRGGDVPGGGEPGAGSDDFGLSQMIQPVTEALSSLGSGELGQPDPRQAFDGIGGALESAGNQVQQALSSLGQDWQGEAATAAQATTRDALAQGAQVADQAAALRSSLATATAAVQDAQARIIEIINVFWAKIAAIGPNIIFPWGIAAAIAAATEAVTSTSAVMAQTEATLGAEAAAVTTAGAPVDVTAMPALGSGAKGLGPLMQMASSTASPVMQAIGSASSAAPDAGAPADASAASAGRAPASGTASGGAAGGGAAGAARGGLAATVTAAAPAGRTPGAAAPVATADAATTAQAKPVGAGAAGAPMGGAGPMGHQGKAGAADHTAADYLHTSDQGNEIVGDLGSVAPRVIGEKDPLDSPQLGLRIR
jgi:uncharacterized protein YukE